MMPEREACLRAVASRDARFDGVFFTAVSSTRIFCRPSCPARTPRAENCSFLPTAAAAHAAGYRACKRCRPDSVPGSPDWDVRADVCARAVRLIGDGVIDREGVRGLAGRLGFSTRQLERIILAELGATPVELARAQRAHTARVLLETTSLPITEVAFAAGFRSLRAFNETIAATYATTPSTLRERRRHNRRDRLSPNRAQRTHPGDNNGEGELRNRLGGARPGDHLGDGSPRSRTADDSAGFMSPIRLRLAYREPFNPSNVFGHLAATAVPGVEEWRDQAFRSTVRLAHGHGIVTLRPAAGHVAATLWLSDLRDLAPAIGRCRRLLDLDSDPEAVDAALAREHALAPLVEAGPGRRVPRSLDPDAFALRAVLGQQVSTAAAQTLTGRLVAARGEPIDDPEGGLTHLFPTPEQLTDLQPGELKVPVRRAVTFVALARALADGSIDLSPGADRATARHELATLPGIGPWTVETVAMRALGDPDAFPASDLGIRRATEHLGLTGDLTSRAADWRPWRSYATQYLWAVMDHPINHLPEEDRCRTAS